MTRRRAAFALAGTAAGVVVAWLLMAWLLAADRGLDLTDESLYLLAADRSTTDAAWHLPFGWHTGPLYRLAGHDIARFRTLGGLVVVATGALLGGVVGRAVVPCDGATRTASPLSAAVGLGAAVGGIGSLLVYGGMLRTPGYNLVNVVGLGLAMIGFVALMDGRPELSRRDLWRGALASFGLFVTIPAKPTSAVLGLAIGVVLVLASRGRGATLRLVPSVGAGVLAWVGLAVVSGLWPRGFVDVLRRAARWPVLDPSHRLGDAVAAIDELPSAVWDGATSLTGSTYLVIGAAALAAGLAVAAGARATQLAGPLLAASMAGFTVAALHASGLIESIAHRGTSRPRFADVDITTTCLLVLVGVAVVATADRWRTGRRAGPAPASVRGRRPALVVALVAAPVVFAFGSTNGLYPQAALAGGFVLLAAFVVATSCRDRSTATAAMVSIVVVATGAAFGVLADGRLAPYRTPPLAADAVAVEIGPDRSTLLVDATTAELAQSSLAQVDAAGWTPGTPMLAVQWRWNSFLPYHLGATTPSSLMVTLFGYDGSVRLAERTLGAEQAGDRDWTGAWIVVSASSVSVDTAQVQAVIERVERLTSRPFPEDYRRVAVVQRVEIWAPSGPSPGDEG